MRKYVALIHRGPQWLWGRSVYEQGQPIEEHLQAMREHFDSGVLLLGGPFDEDGGIALLEVPDEQTAHDVMQADPAVVAGVITYEMRSLRPIFDTTSQTPASGTATALAKAGEG